MCCCGRLLQSAQTLLQISAPTTLSSDSAGRLAFLPAQTQFDPGRTRSPLKGQLIVQAARRNRWVARYISGLHNDPLLLAANHPGAQLIAITNQQLPTAVGKFPGVRRSTQLLGRPQPGHNRIKLGGEALHMGTGDSNL